jgi:hypothetical protein
MGCKGVDWVHLARGKTNGLFWTRQIFGSLKDTEFTDYLNEERYQRGLSSIVRITMLFFIVVTKHKCID